MRYQAVIDGGRKKILLEQSAPDRFSIEGKEHQVDLGVIEEGIYSLIINGASCEVTVRDEKKGMVVEIGAHLIPVRLEDPAGRRGEVTSPVQEKAVIASPMPGRVVGIKSQVGEVVKAGEGVIVVEAMKMENELHAPKGGKIKSIAVKVGEAVEAGQELVTIE